MIQRFDSFAPVRSHAECKYYVDGESYFNDIYDSFSAAREEIFITGWWLSPYLYLKRPVSAELNQESRLDRVLQQAALRGVMVSCLK
jgi:phospholipase D1/2